MATEAYPARLADPTAPRIGKDGHADAGAYATEGEVPGDVAALRAAAEAWRSGLVASTVARMPPRRARFSTWSDAEVPDVLTSADRRVDYARDLGFPGEYPYTRGV